MLSPFLITPTPTPTPTHNSPLRGMGGGDRNNPLLLKAKMIVITRRSRHFFPSAMLVQCFSLDLKHTFYYNQSVMSLLPPFLRRLFQKKQQTDDDFRIYFSDQELVFIIREVAQKQGRSEEEVLTEFAKAGKDLLFNNDILEEQWDSLTGREQEVLALLCLGHHNYQIAKILGISRETVKTHLQHIFSKFHLHSVKELRRALKTWSFTEWWDTRQH